MVVTMDIAATVLGTVNAPYGRKLTAAELAFYLSHMDEAKTVPGHMSSFFAEVTPQLQAAFAASVGISLPELVEAARALRIGGGFSASRQA
jgi:hypothetical protein